MEIEGDCDPTESTCVVRIGIPIEVPGNHHNTLGAGYNDSPLKLVWTDLATSQVVGTCGNAGAAIRQDLGEAVIRVSFSCSSGGGSVYELEAITCDGIHCEESKKQTVDATLEGMAVEMGCELPPQEDCEQCGGCQSLGGPGGGSMGGAGGGSLGGGPGLGPGAHLRYKAGSIGARGMPGSDEWDLGRFWSHTYASRVFPAAYDGPYADRVFLLTSSAVYVEYADGDGDGVYETRRPESDYRTLERVDSGWTLTDLDGTVEHYGADGTWRRKVDRAGNATVGTYEGGRLARVGFPDGRSETFHYNAGDLVRITEIGVGGAASRSWHYTWEGQDLVRVDRPDGTAFEYRYDDPRHPGYMTRTTLVGRDGTSRRITAAWEYDDVGNAVRMWRGAETFENGVDAWELRFDDPELPTVTTYVDPLGDESIRRWAERDSRHEKARLVQVEGECPTCGLDPSTVLEYGDPQNPYRPTKEVDGNGTVTLYSYDEYGRMTSRTEAFATPLERLTRWEYHDAYPALTTLREEPSTYPSALKRTIWEYDARGLLVARTVEGIENDEAFSYTTRTTRTPEGHQASIDPPGFEVPGNTDVVTFTYDPDRGGQVVTSRTDPIVGTSRYGYDAFNRRTSVVDVNGVETVTEYDDAGRVTAVIQKGATSSEDLVTRNVYDVFGDLDHTILPQGNVVDYEYDDDGRLVSIERRPDLATHGERTVYQLDLLGRRIREDRQEWTTDGWITHFWRESAYNSLCNRNSTINSDGTAAEFKYDCTGKLVAQWAPSHSTKNSPPTNRYYYDALGRLVRIDQLWELSEADYIKTLFSYGPSDNLSQVLDANQNQTIYKRSDRSLVTEERSPSTGTTFARYDAHGNQVQIINAKGETLARVYDPFDRLLEVQYPNPLNNIYLEYGEDTQPFSTGRLTAVTRHRETLLFSYDRFGRLIRDGGLEFTYDKNSNRTRINYPNGASAMYVFDYSDRPFSAQVNLGEGEKTLVQSAKYLPFGPLSEISLGNGLTEHRTYNARYFPQSIQVSPYLHWTFETDGLGNPIKIRDLLSDETYLLSYQYPQNYLNSIEVDESITNWTYDFIGNRLSEAKEEGLTTYEYAHNQSGGKTPLLIKATNATLGASMDFLYDTAGNQILRRSENSATIYQYSASNRLESILKDTKEHPDARSYFTYDGRGFLRSVKSELPTTEEVTRELQVVYSSDGVLHQRHAVNQLTSEFSRQSQPFKRSDTVFYFNLRPIAIAIETHELPENSDIASEQSFLFLGVDHRDFPILATGDDGSLQWSGDFHPFGDIERKAPFIGLPGQWKDPSWIHDEHPLYYNLFRWYSADLGRYNRADPIGIREGINQYVYAKGNPVLYIDRHGLEISVAPAFQPLVDCGKQTPLFETAWEWFENNGTWSVSPIDEAPVFLETGQTLPIGKDYGVPDCNKGGRIFPDNRSQSFLTGDLACKTILRKFAHEVLETWAHCDLGLSNDAAHQFVQRGPKPHGNGLDDDVAEKGCASCKCKGAFD